MLSRNTGVIHGDISFGAASNDGAGFGDGVTLARNLQDSNPGDGSADILRINLNYAHG